MKVKDPKISARIPAPLKELMRKYVERAPHLNQSDLVRDAIREKIERDAPELYRELFRIVEARP